MDCSKMNYETLPSQVFKLVQETKQLTVQKRAYEDEIDKLIGEMTALKLKRDLPSDWSERLRPRKKRKTETGYVATQVNSHYLPHDERYQNGGQHQENTVVPTMLSGNY